MVSLYHMGFRRKRSTLADANESRDRQNYAEFAQVLIAITRPLYAPDPMGSICTGAYVHWTPRTIDLCSCFRTLLDLHGNILTLTRIIDGKRNDLRILEEIIPDADAFYVMDRGYSIRAPRSFGSHVILTSFENTSVYPDTLRRVSYLDLETSKRFKFLTNNFTPTRTRDLSNLQVGVAGLYCKRVKQP